VPEQSVTDDEILALAQEIKTERGVSLVEAMDIASVKLNNAGKEIDCNFKLDLTLKPRVAKFFRDSFSGHPDLSVEERLSKFVEMQLNKLRGEALARTRSEAEIEEGKANTIRRSTFLARNLQG
jgi:hypothetical protein